MEVVNPKPACRLRRVAAFLTQGRPRGTLPCLTRIRPARRRRRLGAAAGLCPAADVSAGRPQPLPVAVSAGGGRGPATWHLPLARRGGRCRHAPQRWSLRVVSSAPEHEATSVIADRKKREAKGRSQLTGEAQRCGPSLPNQSRPTASLPKEIDRPGDRPSTAGGVQPHT